MLPGGQRWLRYREVFGNPRDRIRGLVGVAKAQWPLESMPPVFGLLDINGNQNGATGEFTGNDPWLIEPSMFPYGNPLFLADSEGTPRNPCQKKDNTGGICAENPLSGAEVLASRSVPSRIASCKGWANLL